ncbi:hypothetical protein [Rufibacter hautae]|uniref:Uncharacterized protein n=1 Tax=Rufibacter hautae TaxID=2595005 RepID=A0A5B6TMV0_9BACT|nr:hypothetical protein [Rufibacter hautae]KAA3437643.1 hypothetical protein FOA19_10055 [Rufibacter hautae]
MKNQHLLLILLIPFLTSQNSCTQPEKQERSILAEPSPSAPLTTSYKGGEIEYLDGGSVRIAGKLPLVSTVQRMNSLLGKPDSVVAIDLDGCTSGFRSEESKMVYYSGYVFEQFRDTLYFMDATFTKSNGNFLQFNDLRLDSSTTLEEIQRRFPASAKELNPVTMTEFGEVLQLSLAPYKEPTDNRWVLILKNGNLVLVENWFGC